MGRHSAPTQPALRILVTGSEDWPNSGAVAEAMLRVWLDHGQPLDTAIITTGNPTGAEQMAVTIAGQRGWNIEAIDFEHVSESRADVQLDFDVTGHLSFPAPGDLPTILYETKDYGYLEHLREWRNR